MDVEDERGGRDRERGKIAQSEIKDDEENSRVKREFSLYTALG